MKNIKAGKGDSENKMSKENTHLFIADKISREIQDEKIKSIIKNNFDCYLLGSVAFDSFFYSASEKVTKASDALHDEHEKGDIFSLAFFGVFASMLQKAKGKELGDKDMAFLLGYVTHYAVDTAFHPFVESVTGDYYDADPIKRKKNVYNHRLLETFMDTKINKSFFLGKNIRFNLDLIDDLYFAELVVTKTGISKEDIKDSLGRQMFYGKIFKAPLWLVRWKDKTKQIKEEDYGLFYGEVKKQKNCELFKTVSDAKIETMMNEAILTFSAVVVDL